MVTAKLQLCSARRTTKHFPLGFPGLFLIASWGNCNKKLHMLSLTLKNDILRSWWCQKSQRHSWGEGPVCTLTPFRERSCPAWSKESWDHTCLQRQVLPGFTTYPESSSCFFPEQSWKSWNCLKVLLLLANQILLHQIKTQLHSLTLTQGYARW